MFSGMTISPKNLTVKPKQTGQDTRARKGQPLQNSLKRIFETGLPGPNCQDRTRQPEWYN
jgi:hypothetical protein